jgi:hypothetical protein
VSEVDSRALAARVASWLGDPSRRGDAPRVVPATVASASGRAVIVDRGKRKLGLYPVRGGCVLDAAALVVPPAELAEAARRLSWPAPLSGSDWPWLTAWLRSPKARAAFVVVSDAWSAPELSAALSAALSRTSADPAAVIT